MLEKGHKKEPGPPAGAELEELRKLLFGQEREDIQRLTARVDDPEQRAADVSEVLAEAINIRSATDDATGAALSPMIEDSLRASIKRDPQKLVDVIFPIMGPAIRRSIGETLQRMMQSLNEALEHSMSPRSFGWRLEAWRTGRPFSEIVLLHTLEYRVDQVFLIHRATGLPLQHVHSDPATGQDSDLVSGMLTAIQDFVRDSFGGTDDATLDAIEVGALLVWIAPGPHAVLAAVIRGTAPLELRTALEECIEDLHARHGSALQRFSGDAAPFDVTRPRLEECLVQVSRDKGPRRKPWPAMIAVSLLVAGAVWWWVAAARTRARWDGLVERLRSEPGLVVTHAARHDGYVLRGLRDPLALDPASVIDSAGFSGADMISEWAVFHAADPDFVRRRIDRALPRPEGVELAIEDGRVVLSGTAPTAWIADARLAVLALPGVTAVDIGALRASDADRLLRARLAGVLAPPDTVDLRVSAARVRLSGTAATEWIERATVLARALPEVVAVDTTELQPDDTAERILRQARRILAPPQTVELTVEAGVVLVTGSATQQWIDLARRLAVALSDVAALDLSGVAILNPPPTPVERARQILKPPASVTLTVDADGTLRAAGASSHAWLEEARAMVTLVPDITASDFSAVVDRDLPAILLDRARLALRPPPSITLKIVGTQIVASGAASALWLQEAQRLAPLVEGITDFRAVDVVDTDRQRFEALAQRVATRTFFFENDSAAMVTGQRGELTAQANDILELLDVAPLARARVRIRVFGFSSAEGESGRDLGTRRAGTIVEHLVNEGVPPRALTAIGVGQPELMLDRARALRVEFEVERLDAP